MIYNLIIKLITPLDTLKKEEAENVSTKMFDNYQNIDPEYVPNNRESKVVINPAIENMEYRLTPNIVTSRTYKDIVYNCYVEDNICFEIAGNIFDDAGEEIDLVTFLSGKRAVLSLYNFWGDLVGRRSSIINSKVITVPTPIIFSGIYTAEVELLDENNSPLTLLFSRLDGVFNVMSYIDDPFAKEVYVNKLPIKVVSQLPEDPKEGIIYLLALGYGNYDQYLYVNGSWILVGDNVSDTVDYNEIINKPLINGYIVEGSKISNDYDLQDEMDTITNSDIVEIVSTGGKINAY